MYYHFTIQIIPISFSNIQTIPRNNNKKTVWLRSTSMFNDLLYWVCKYFNIREYNFANTILQHILFFFSWTMNNSVSRSFFLLLRMTSRSYCCLAQERGALVFLLLNFFFKLFLCSFQYVAIFQKLQFPIKPRL